MRRISQDSFGAGLPLDPCFPVGVRQLRIEANQRPTLGRSGFFQVIFLHSGALRFHARRRVLRALGGDALVVGGVGPRGVEGEAHGTVSLSELSFEPALLRDAAGAEEAEYLAPFLLREEGLPRAVPARTGVPGEIWSLVSRIGGELPATSSRARLAVKTYLRMILILLVNHYSSLPETAVGLDRRNRQVERLRPLFAYLARHLREDIHVRDAARMCALSESHFMCVFRDVTGESFRAYLNRYRIERAEALLAGTERPIAEVCLDVGFCGQSYFGSVFRRLTGMTPLNYRKRAANPPV